MKNKIIIILMSLIMNFVLSSKAYAHVKWFSQFTFSDKPLTLGELFGPLFWGMMGLSIVAISLLVVLDRKLDKTPKIETFKKSLSRLQGHSLTIMRAAAAAVLLLCFQSDSLFVPELKVSSPLIGWIQFLLALLLLFPRTVILSGAGIIGLYVYGLVQFGWFHMLDYVVFAGVGYYLLVGCLKSEKIKDSGLIALYATVGLSLCWVAIEKLLYPQWSLYILEQNPQLALGLNFNFFLIAAAFVEFSLGYLMIICLLQRPLALVVTLVFFMTTLVFGKTEVIGHTIIHASLIVFLIEGSGRFFRTPINLHNRLSLKIAFAAVNFVVLLFVLLIPYQNIAMGKHVAYIEKRNEVAVVDTTDWRNPPQVTLGIMEDNHAGWNLQIITKNFLFTPENSGNGHKDGEGHAHLYIDDQKAGRVYGPWYYIPSLTPGKHEIKVTLNTNNHKMYMNNERSIEDSVTIEVDSGKKKMDHE